MKLLLRPVAKGLLLAGMLPLVACSSGPATVSRPLVTDVDHTVVKRQSIGNCWLYAHSTWLESMLKRHTGDSIDVSESYWTWWHWYEQIVGQTLKEIETGGEWRTSSAIILNHGWVTEGDFIADEAGQEMSARQAAALAYMNDQLKRGAPLGRKADRTPAKVRRALDRAFGAKMADAEAIARDAASTYIGLDATAEVSLAEALAGDAEHRWQVIQFPRLFGRDAQVTTAITQRRQALLKRVFKALNAKEPVVISLMIDFNAMDAEDEGSFKKELLDAAGPGDQGGHMLVLEDYTVDNVPGYGSLGEGDFPAEAKAAAVNGDLKYLVAKNSWGTNRADRGLTDGYTRFYADYLFGNLAWKWSEDAAANEVSYYTTLTDFILPPGF